MSLVLHDFLLTCEIKDEDAADRIFEVGRHKTFEFLLTSRVPELKPTRNTFELDVFAHKIDADSRLGLNFDTLKN